MPFQRNGLPANSGCIVRLPYRARSIAWACHVRMLLPDVVSVMIEFHVRLSTNSTPLMGSSPAAGSPGMRMGIRRSVSSLINADSASMCVSFIESVVSIEPSWAPPWISAEPSTT